MNCIQELNPTFLKRRDTFTPVPLETTMSSVNGGRVMHKIMN